MNRAATTTVLLLVAVWAVAHLLYLGPVETATEALVTWITVFAAASAVIAACTVLVWGLFLGHRSPAWYRFVEQARTAAMLVGMALVVVGLVHYRDTEPRNELHLVMLGCAVLAGAVFVQGWLFIAARRRLG
jgi:hypothetical protein